MGPAKGPHLHGSPGTVAEGFVHEGSESRRGRAAEEGEGGQEEEEAAKVAGAGTGEDTDSNDDNDDDVADDVKWDILENEDVLRGIGSSLQESGSFPFHRWEGMSGEAAEMGCTVSIP